MKDARGNWNEAWTSFDSRGKAKQSAAAHEGDGPGLFGDGAGSVAAE